MIGKQLFFRRLREEIGFQTRVLRSVFDWSIILYMVIPAFIVMGFVYIEMWQDVHLYWSDDIPLFLLVGIALLLLLRGNFRTFLYEADTLFLLQQSYIFYPLKKWSFHYSLLRLFAETGGLIILILPILCLAYGYRTTEVLLLFVFLFSCRLLMITIKKIVTQNVLKWSLLIMIWLLAIYSFTVLSSWILFGINIVTIGIVYVVYRTYYVQSKSYFLQDLDLEREERSRYISLIFGFSTEVEKSPKIRGTKPRFFFPSRKIFQNQDQRERYGLLELLLKSFLRNAVLLSGYINLIGISIIALFIMPVWAKWFIFFAFILFINSWIKSIYEKLLDHQFFTVIPYDEQCLPFVWTLFRRWVGIPVITLVGGLTVIFSSLELFF